MYSFLASSKTRSGKLSRMTSRSCDPSSAVWWALKSMGPSISNRPSSDEFEVRLITRTMTRKVNRKSLTGWTNDFRWPSLKDCGNLPGVQRLVRVRHTWESYPITVMMLSLNNSEMVNLADLRRCPQLGQNVSWSRTSWSQLWQRLELSLGLVKRLIGSGGPLY